MCDTPGARYFYENRKLSYEVELEMTIAKNNAGLLLRCERQHDFYLHAGNGNTTEGLSFAAPNGNLWRNLPI